MPTAHAVVFHEFGEPTEVARYEAIEVPAPGEGEVVVRMSVAPIHPADLNRLEGRYGEKPSLPSVGGIEGYGVVESRGNGVIDLDPGTPVAVAHLAGTWSERVIVPVGRIAVVPPGVSPELAALMIVNPSTAWRMLRDFVDLNEGEWLILNAANSSVGRSVIEIARAKGWRTLAVVRRPELLEELKEAGAAAALLDDNDLVEQARSVTGSAPIRLALNGVGGASALRLANLLAPGGTLVTYGAMGRQPLQIPNGLLIFKDLRLRGFWVTQWFRQAGVAETRVMLDAILAMAATGALSAKVAATFPLSEPVEALRAAAMDRREGKILFRM